MNDSDYDPQPHEILKGISWELSELNKKIDTIKKGEALDFIYAVEAMHNGLADEIRRTNDNLEVLIEKLSKNQPSGIVTQQAQFDWRGADYAMLLILALIAWRVW